MTLLTYLTKAVTKYDLEAFQFIELCLVDYQEKRHITVADCQAVADIIVTEEDKDNIFLFAKALCDDVLDERLVASCAHGDKTAKEYIVQIRPDEGSIVIEPTTITISRKRDFMGDMSLDPDDVI